jgi:O-antigen ligase
MVCILSFAALFLLAPKLPLSVQRSLSILPLPVDAAAQADAKASTEWRIRMWQALLPEVARHLWIGKGFTASPADYYLAAESVRRGYSQDYELTILSGDYHNGPLSIIIPFGIWGSLAFLAFVVAALRLLYRNYQYGDPGLVRINTFLFSYFITKLIIFLAVYGAIHADIVTFAGLAGLSISLNGGVASPGASTSFAEKDPEIVGRIPSRV